MTSDEDYGDNSDRIFELRFSQQEFSQAFQKIIDDIVMIKQFSQKWAMNYLPKEFRQSFVEVFDKCIDLNLS
ncbi:hypothetical protein [Moraxella sp.]|uniref:hypothetical protein n=1 Tax=Moraxella sp. TaxID=479 RepID=UPI0026DCD973|nr:hypothetical protein [Moraxella sp.]MDO4894854.1 hypothetical protein [Moraxella sp.]